MRHKELNVGESEWMRKTFSPHNHLKRFYENSIKFAKDFAIGISMILCIFLYFHLPGVSGRQWRESGFVGWGKSFNKIENSTFLFVLLPPSYQSAYAQLTAEMEKYCIYNEKVCYTFKINRSIEISLQTVWLSSRKCFWTGAMKRGESTFRSTILW
jgi:hypothetical protein